MEDQLSSKGWSLSEEGLQACLKATGKDNATTNDVINVALRTDLRQIAKKQLPDNVTSGQVESVSGPVVLQVQKVRNISAPIANQESKGAPRMLKLNMTDGVNHCVAIEFDSISFITPDLIPGTKVCLLGKDIAVVKGCILLTRDNIKVLGGEVEVLKTKWESSKQVDTVKRFGKIKDDPPPEFKEFDGTRKPRSAQRKHTTTAPETTTTTTTTNNKTNYNNNSSRTTQDTANKNTTNVRTQSGKAEQKSAPPEEQKKTGAPLTKDPTERRENNRNNINSTTTTNSNNNNNNNNRNNNSNNASNNRNNKTNTAAATTTTTSNNRNNDNVSSNTNAKTSNSTTTNKDNATSKNSTARINKGSNEGNRNELIDDNTRTYKQKYENNEKMEQARNAPKSGQNRNNDKKEFNNDKKDDGRDTRKDVVNRNNENRSERRNFDQNNYREDRNRHNDRNDFNRNDSSDRNRNNRKDFSRGDDRDHDKRNSDRKDFNRNNRDDYDRSYYKNSRDQPNRNDNGDSGFHDRLRQLADYEDEHQKQGNRDRGPKSSQNDQHKKDTQGSARGAQTKKNPQGGSAKESGAFKYDDEYDRKMPTKKTEKDLWQGGVVDSEEPFEERRRGERDNRKPDRGRGGGSRNNYYDYNDREESGERRISAKERRQASGKTDWASDRNQGDFEWSSNRNTRGGGRSDSRNYRDSGWTNDRRGDSSQGSSRASSASRGNGRTYYDGDNNYDSGRGRNDQWKNDRDKYDRDYDRNNKGAKSKDQRGQGRHNQYDQYGEGRTNDKEDETNPVPYSAAKDRTPGKDDKKKPVAYNASNQSWYYDGEEKPVRENASSNDMLTVTFKNEASGSKDGDSKKGGTNDERNRQVNEGNRDRNQGRRDYDNRKDHFDDRGRDNNGRNNREQFQGRKDENKKPPGKAGLHPNRQTDYNNKSDAKSNRDDFRPQRKQSSDSRSSSKGSRDGTPNKPGYRTNDRSSAQKKKDQSKHNDANESQTSPGRRIPLEVLFGKSPSGSVDNELDAIDNISTSVSNLSLASDPSCMTHPPPGMHQAGHHYPKMTSKEIMERSLEQDPFGSATHPDLLYMQQFSQLTQLQQQQMNFYQQQLAAAPYIGFPSEHTGVGAASAAPPPGISPYLAFGNTVEYSQLPLHQLQQQVGAAGGQNLGAGGAYYYPLTNTTQPMPPATILEQYQ